MDADDAVRIGSKESFKRADSKDSMMCVSRIEELRRWRARDDEDRERMTAPVFPSELPSWSNVTSQMNPEWDNQTCGDDDNFKYLAYTVTYSVVFPIGFISNFVALLVFLCLTSKKTANTVFMTNLAISDAGFSLTLPFRLVYYFRNFQWDFPDWLCRWSVFSFYVNLYTSVLFLTGLSVLRYVAVVHPVRHRSLVTVRRASLACLVIWIFVSCLSLPFLMTGAIKHQERWRCFDPGSLTSWNRIFTLNYVGVFFGFVIPFVTILFCYGCIICKLVRERKIGNRKRNTRQRSVYLIAVVMSTFLLCFLPYHVARTLHLHAKVSEKPCRVVRMWLRVLVISLCTAVFNSCFNPLLYYFAGETFRSAIRRVSTRATVSSINQGAFYPSLRRRLSGTWLRMRRQSYTGSTQNSSLAKSQEKTGGWVSAEECKLSELPQTD